MLGAWPYPTDFLDAVFVEDLPAFHNLSNADWEENWADQIPKQQRVFHPEIDTVSPGESVVSHFYLLLGC